MTVISNAGLAKWLNEHATRKVYDARVKKVAKLCGGTASNKGKFEKLAANKNLVLLTRAAFGKKMQTTFFHSVVGVPIGTHVRARRIPSGPPTPNALITTHNQASRRRDNACARTHTVSARDQGSP